MWDDGRGRVLWGLGEVSQQRPLVTPFWAGNTNPEILALLHLFLHGSTSGIGLAQFIMQYGSGAVLEPAEAVKQYFSLITACPAQMVLSRNPLTLPFFPKAACQGMKSF